MTSDIRCNFITGVDTAGVDFVRGALEPLCGGLHDVFSESVAESLRFRAQARLVDDEYNSMGADVTRALVHRKLSQLGAVGGWHVAGQHRLRGQLLLRCGLIRLRLLHDPQHVVPPPGHTRARRAYYRNVPLGQSSAFDAEASRLVAVWRVTDPELAQVSFRVVRPIGDTGRWAGPATEVDLDFILPNAGVELSLLEFEQVDEGLLLDLPEEDGGMGETQADNGR